MITHFQWRTEYKKLVFKHGNPKQIFVTLLLHTFK